MFYKICHLYTCYFIAPTRVNELTTYESLVIVIGENYQSEPFIPIGVGFFGPKQYEASGSSSVTFPAINCYLSIS